MFFVACNGWPQENSATESLRCQHCGNTTDHQVFVEPNGPQLSFIFLKKPLAGFKKYFLVCPTCGHQAKEITKEQAAAMRRSP